MTTNTYYVQGEIDASGEYAICNYFYDKAALEPATLPLRIPTKAGACVIAQADQSKLLLLGSVYKTIGMPPALNNNNYAPATDEGAITVPMPTTEVVTKGVVLLFADRDKVTALYPSSDPEIINENG